MKKIYNILIVLLSLTLLLTSCRRMRISNNYSAPMATSMPAVVVRENEISSMDISDTKEQPEEEPLQVTGNNQEFEKLRETILNILPDGDGLEFEIEKSLISHDENKIILAKVCPYDTWSENLNIDLIDTLTKKASFEVIIAGGFEMLDGILVESELKLVPVLATVDENTGALDKMFVPEIYDEQKRAEDVKKIFGIENEKDFGLQYEKNKYSDFEEELHRLKYEIALKGGFDGFGYKTVDMLRQLTENGFTDPTEMKGAIRGFFLANTFECSSITVPIWHEFGREDKDDSVKLYTMMHFGKIFADKEIEPETGIYSMPAVIEMKCIGGTWTVKEVAVISADGSMFVDGVKENFGDYDDDCLAFSGTQKSKDMTQELEGIINSLIEGTFNPEE